MDEGLLCPSSRQGRRLLEAQGGVSRSAERDLRLCLKKPRTFEKVRSKLSSYGKILRKALEKCVKK